MQTIDTTHNIGWIGTGVMGRSMSAHIRRAGFPVVIHSRTKEKAQPTLDLGATWANSVQELAAKSRVIFVMVGLPNEAKDVFDAIFETIQPGTIIIDMATNPPSFARELASRAAAKQCHSLDAPVSGGDIGAKEARLSIMVGGDKEAFDAVLPLFQCMGKTIVLQGGAGAGQHTKMVNQILIATGMIGVAEALIYGHQAGLDLPTVLQSVGGGAAASWSLLNYGPRMMNRNFDPGFFVEHFIKDMGIALEEARRMNLSLPGLALANQLYIAVQAQGMGKLGTHSLLLALEHLNGLKSVAPVAKSVKTD
jgi:3-hydroxyisobutyrate dehydrogenase